jgi:hypothetical protein
VPFTYPPSTHVAVIVKTPTPTPILRPASTMSLKLPSSWRVVAHAPSR